MARVHNVNLNWLLTGNGEMFLAQPTLKIRKNDKKIVLKNFGGKINRLQTENDLSLSEAAAVLEKHNLFAFEIVQGCYFYKHFCSHYCIFERV